MKNFDAFISRCKICNSDRIFKYHQASDGSQIYKCGDCKIQFLNPQYSDEFLLQFYAGYTRDQGSFDETLFKSHSECLLYLEKFKPFKGQLFDIGSGNGHLIQKAKERGWIPTGYDIDFDTVKEINRKSGVQMLCGKFEKIEHKKEEYDAVTMLHVFEHLKDPVQYLKIIHSVLKPEGILFIALPNIHSRSALFKLFLEKTGIKKKNIADYYDTQHHLWYYTPDTIRYILETYGFEIKFIYSRSFPVIRKSKIMKTISEKYLSNFFWTSNMVVIAEKNKLNT